MTKISRVVLGAAALGLVSVAFAPAVQSAEKNLKKYSKIRSFTFSKP